MDSTQIFWMQLLRSVVVFGIVAVVKHAQCNVVDPAPVPCDQAFERVGVTALRRSNKLQVAGVGWGAIGQRIQGFHEGSGLFLNLWTRAE